MKSNEIDDVPRVTRTELIAPAPAATDQHVEVEKQVEEERFLDLSAHILANQAYEYSDNDARSVRRKIDRHLMPVLFFTGMISAVDKIVVSNRGPLWHDLGSQYQPEQSELDWGHRGLWPAVWQAPAAYMVQRLKLNILVPTMIILWERSRCCSGLHRTSRRSWL